MLRIGNVIGECWSGRARDCLCGFLEQQLRRRHIFLLRLALGAIALSGTAYLAHLFLGDPDLGAFFVWDVVSVWFWELLLVGGYFSLGQFLTAHLGLPQDRNPAERRMIAAALGVTAYVLISLLLGVLSLYRPSVAVLVPTLLLGLSGRRWFFALRAMLLRPPLLHLTPLQSAVACFGLLAAALLYLPLLSPASVSTDAAWFHLSTAEEYARQGRMVPFYGDWAKSIPQLTSLLQVYAFLVPGLEEPQRWVLALHTEFVLVLFTLQGITVFSRYLAQGLPSRFAWVVFCLFPSVYIYDSNLGGAADHAAAFFAIPHALYVLRFVKSPNRRDAALAGVFAGASFLTKLQASYLFSPLVLVQVAALLWASLRKRQIDWNRSLDSGLYFATFLLAFRRTSSRTGFITRIPCTRS